MNAKIVCLSAVAFTGLSITGVLRGDAGVSLVQRLDSDVTAAPAEYMTAAQTEQTPRSWTFNERIARLGLSRKNPTATRPSIPLRPVARPEATCQKPQPPGCILRAKPDDSAPMHHKCPES
jgi:hypothetical protein